MISLFSLLLWAAAILLTIKALGLAWRSPLWLYLLFSLCKHTLLLGAFLTGPQAYSEAFWLLRLPEYVFKGLLAGQLCLGLVDERFRLALRGWMIFTMLAAIALIGWPQTESVCIELGQFCLLLCLLYLIVVMGALGRSNGTCWVFLIGLGLQFGSGWLHAQWGGQIATIPSQLAGLMMLSLWTWQLHQEEKARSEPEERLPVVPQKDPDVKKKGHTYTYAEGHA